MTTMVSRTLSVHQEHELLLRLESAGLDSQLAQQVIDSKGNELASKIVQLIAAAGVQSPVATKVARLVKALNIICEGTATRASQLIQCRYNRVNELVTDDLFPIQPHDPVSRYIEFLQFDPEVTFQEVLAEFDRRGLDRPTYEDCLYCGIQHPGGQRKHPIVFLHEPVRGPGGSPFVLMLDGGADGRELDLYWFGREWDRIHVFAGVHRSTSPAGGAGQAS